MWSIEVVGDQPVAPETRPMADLAVADEQRRREFGVRIALGASRSSVLGLVLRGAATMIAAGTLGGLGLALAFSKTISAFLFGVPPVDPVTLAGVVLVLAVTAALAARGTGLARSQRRSSCGASQRLSPFGAPQPSRRVAPVPVAGTGWKR